jgi:hypothetical protein
VAPVGFPFWQLRGPHRWPRSTRCSAHGPIFMWLVRDCSSTAPAASRSATLNATFGATMASIKRHTKLHLMNKSWTHREDWFVARIPDGAAVLDMGAGAMHLRVALRAAGRRAFSYTPVDVTDRGDPRMLLCHFNLHEYPLRVLPVPTVVVLQGVIEYVYDKALLLRSLRCAYPRAHSVPQSRRTTTHAGADVLTSSSCDCSSPLAGATFLLSYAVGHRTGENEAHGWVAPLTRHNLRELFGVFGLSMSESTSCLAGQQCMRLTPTPLASLPAETCGGFGFF